MAEAVPRNPRLEPIGGDEFCLGLNVLTVIYAEKHFVTFRLVPGGQMTRPKWRFRQWARKAQVVKLGKENPMHLTSATKVTPEVEAGITDAFEYHPWSAEQIERGRRVKDALIEAMCMIIQNVPPSPDRTTAIRKIREARMDCNSAITHGGKY